MNTLNDNELFLLIKEGDDRAFSQLFHRYWERLYIEAHSILKDEPEACDIVQDVFIWLWQKRTSVAIAATLKGYLLQAVRNKCMSKLEKNATYEQRRKQYAYFKETVITTTPIENSELGRSLQQAIGELGQASRKAFEMIYIEQKSRKEAALELGISTETVKTHIRNVLRKLRVSLKNVAEI